MVWANCTTRVFTVARILISLTMLHPPAAGAIPYKNGYIYGTILQADKQTGGRASGGRAGRQTDREIFFIWLINKLHVIQPHNVYQICAIIMIYNINNLYYMSQETQCCPKHLMTTFGVENHMCRHCDSDEHT